MKEPFRTALDEHLSNHSISQKYSDLYQINDQGDNLSMRSYLKINSQSDNDPLQQQMNLYNNILLSNESCHIEKNTPSFEIEEQYNEERKECIQNCKTKRKSKARVILNKCIVLDEFITIEENKEKQDDLIKQITGKFHFQDKKLLLKQYKQIQQFIKNNNRNIEELLIYLEDQQNLQNFKQALDKPEVEQVQHDQNDEIHGNSNNISIDQDYQVNSVSFESSHNTSRINSSFKNNILMNDDRRNNAINNKYGHDEDDNQEKRQSHTKDQYNNINQSYLNYSDQDTGVILEVSAEYISKTSDLIEQMMAQVDKKQNHQACKEQETFWINSKKITLPNKICQYFRQLQITFNNQCSETLLFSRLTSKSNKIQKSRQFYNLMVLNAVGYLELENIGQKRGFSKISIQLSSNSAINTYNNKQLDAVYKQ